MFIFHVNSSSVGSFEILLFKYNSWVALLGWDFDMDFFNSNSIWGGGGGGLHHGIGYRIILRKRLHMDWDKKITFLDF